MKNIVATLLTLTLLNIVVFSCKDKEINKTEQMEKVDYRPINLPKYISTRTLQDSIK